jgi:hypothetical protein
MGPAFLGRRAKRVYLFLISSRHVFPELRPRGRRGREVEVEEDSASAFRQL